MKQTVSKSKSKKGKEEKKTKISKPQECKKTARKGNTHTSGSQVARGGVAPRRNNRITESATKESREATRKTKKAIQETNGKTTRRKYKTKKGRGRRRTTKGRGKARTDLGQGPHFRRGVRAGSLLALEPRAREKTRGRKRKKCRCAKKKTFIHTRRFPSPSGCV